METQQVLKKLRVKEGVTGIVMNAPSAITEAFRKAGLHETPGNQRYMFVLLFIENSREFLKFINRAIRVTDCEGSFWICYPKGSSSHKSDVNRDSLWELMKPFGMRPVSLISIDETWSALRFRPDGKVKSGK